MRHRLLPAIVCTAFAVACITLAAAADLNRFNDAKFGLFIHWGAYSVRGVEASWPLKSGQVPRAEYEALPQRFNPVKFDAHAWAKLAKRAGMKYVVLTSKHHDGFAMYDTKLSDYSIMHTPFHRDVARELADACRAEGLQFGFYFSLADWHNPDYPSLPDVGTNDPSFKPDPKRWERFRQFMFGQVREICSNYGPLWCIWFDGGWERTPEQWGSADLCAMIRRLQPGILINDRSGPGLGDYGTPEQTIPGAAMGRPWETCMTINNTWAYNPNDLAYKSSKDLIRSLVDIAGKGGNFLLDVGPTPEGTIQPEFVERLERMGQWLHRNGEAIYGTHAAPRGINPCGTATTKGNSLYLHVLTPPDGPLVVKGLDARVLSARILAKREPAIFTQQDGKVSIDLASADIDSYDAVVALELDHPVMFDTLIKPDAQGNFMLLARDVISHGGVCYQPQYDDIGCWINPKDWISWGIATPKSGEYLVVVSQSCPKGLGGSPYSVEIGGRKLEAIVQETNGWFEYPPREIGKVRLRAGQQEVAIRTDKIVNGALMNVKSVELRRIGN
jgi:alpha-L-fucosidase